MPLSKPRPIQWPGASSPNDAVASPPKLSARSSFRVRGAGAFKNGVSPAKRRSLVPSPPRTPGAGETSDKPLFSPPPPPCQPYAAGSIGESRLDAEAALFEINSGRSILDPPPSLFDWEAEVNAVRSVHPALEDSSFGFTSDPRFPLLFEDEQEDGLPQVASPIRLAMRTSPARTNAASARRQGGGPLEHNSFLPIRTNGEDNEDCDDGGHQHQGCSER